MPSFDRNLLVNIKLDHQAEQKQPDSLWKRERLEDDSISEGLYSIAQKQPRKAAKKNPSFCLSSDVEDFLGLVHINISRTSVGQKGLNPLSSHLPLV